MLIFLCDCVLPTLLACQHGSELKGITVGSLSHSLSHCESPIELHGTGTVWSFVDGHLYDTLYGPDILLILLVVMMKIMAMKIMKIIKIYNENNESNENGFRTKITQGQTMTNLRGSTSTTQWWVRVMLSDRGQRHLTSIVVLTIEQERRTGIVTAQINCDRLELYL